VAASSAADRPPGAALEEVSTHPAHTELPPLDVAAIRKVWPDLVKKVPAGLGWRLPHVDPISVVEPDILVIAAKPGYNSLADECGTAEALEKIEQSLQRLIHRPVNVKYERSHELQNAAAEARKLETRRAEALSSDPMVQKVLELFEARSHQTDYDDQEPSAPT
jgi:DNA polymerase-3 subunit gamma/tau